MSTVWERKRKRWGPGPTRCEWLGALLFEPGQGWLRWGMGEREATEYVPDACASYTWPYPVAPPLRRVSMLAHDWLFFPLSLLIARREGLSWEEIRPSTWDDLGWLRDADRAGEER